jgi:putative transposase
VPRAPRYFVDGAYYHVYGRIARGEMLFADGSEASRFVEVIRAVKKRDRLAVLAWCVMGNHYHLAVRTTAVPLWRSIRLIQWRYARQYNRRRRQFGSVWQGRYQVRLVDDHRYLLQLIAYIHLNPVSAGLVDDPCDYTWSGHKELLGKSSRPLVDVDATLGLFGDTRGQARRSYVGLMRGKQVEGYGGENPTELARWIGASDRDNGEAVAAISQALEARPVVERWFVRDIDRFLTTSAALLGVGVAALAGRGKAAEIVRAREIIAIVGVERLGVKVKDLALRLGMSAGSVSRWIVRAAARREKDPLFGQRCDRLETDLAQASKVKPGEW